MKRNTKSEIIWVKMTLTQHEANALESTTISVCRPTSTTEIQKQSGLSESLLIVGKNIHARDIYNQRLEL